MRKMLNNKSFRVFIATFISFMTIASAITTSIYIREVRKERIQYLKTIDEHTENTVDHLNQNFEAVIATSNSIFVSKWYLHYRNHANVYDDNFDIFKRMDITSEIQSKVTALPYVTDILVVIPISDTVIHRRGWSTINNYAKIYGQIVIDLNNDPTTPPSISSEANDACTIVLEDPIKRKHKGIIAVLIDKNSFKKGLEDILPDTFSYIRVETNGQLLYQSGEEKENFIIEDASTKFQWLDLRIGYPDYSDTLIGKSRFTNYLLTEFIVFVLSLIAGIIITMLNLRPLRELISNLGGNINLTKDPYEFISKYIETSSNHNALLREEKDNLARSVNNFISVMKKEILFGMMTNPSFNFQDENILSSISWINNGYPFLLVILESKFTDFKVDWNPDIYTDIIDTPLYDYTFEIFSNNQCMLFWFENNEIADRARIELGSSIESSLHNVFYYAISNVLERPEDMHKAYLTLREILYEQKAQQSTLPISIEIDLINNLQESNSQGCMDIIKRIKDKYCPNTLFKLLERAAVEYGIDTDVIRLEYIRHSKNLSVGGQWNIIYAFAKDICTAIEKYRNARMYEFAKMIRQYVDENYCNPDLSIEEIADHFNVHRTSISKIFKEQFGTTYTDYLLDLRIERATELLKNSGMSITRVGKTVGYRHYTTFKRAFIRYKEISPREFRG
ncbi:MAG: helix-turn-helix transcriptional regulator [Clostridiales bacterium]|nr:helix-turn-helix transcriptional regulator [Clostridiales bacterium]